MTGTVSEIDAMLDAGDIHGAIRGLRHAAATMPLPSLAALLQRVAGMTGFDDMRTSSAAVLADPRDPVALYRLGYACIERGVSAVAVPVLEAALERAPGQLMVLDELVTAYEDQHRYADAVAVLEANEAVLRDWPERYLLSINSLMAGDVDKARRYAARLTSPAGDWASAGRRITAMLDRASVVPGPLDHRALRAWHFVLNGGLLTHLSPYGFEEPMTGRYAFVQDSLEGCRRTLDRLRLGLPAAGVTPTSVSLLTDRSSRILGLAASTVLGLPAVPFEDGRQDTIVVAYDLYGIDPELAPAVRRRAPGAVLVEQATCWTRPPPIAADVTGLLHQTVTVPWGERMVAGGERSAPDDRPEEEIASEIASLDSASSDAGDEMAPGDGDADFAGFVSALRGAWPVTGELRDRLWSPGPVRSSYFA